MNLRKLFHVSLLITLMLVFISPKKVYANDLLEYYLKSKGLDKKPSVTVLVQQPSSNGDSVIDFGIEDNEFYNYVGHVFIRVCDGKPDIDGNIKPHYYGFYPKNPGGTLTSIAYATKGEVHRDGYTVSGSYYNGYTTGSFDTTTYHAENIHGWNVGKYYSLGSDRIAHEIEDYAMRYTTDFKYLEFDGYKLNSNNCTTFVARALRWIDTPVQFYSNTWYYRSGNLNLPLPITGYSPASAGQDLQNASGWYFVRIPPLSIDDKTKVETRWSYRYY